MHVNRSLAWHYAAAVLAVLVLAAPLAGQTGQTDQFTPSAARAAVHIDNFGKISDTYYRGAQPEATDYADLAALGIHTVIDLTRDGRDDEQGLVQRSGMQFYRIPLTTTDRPSAAAIAQFLTLVSDPVNQPVYVHCQGGRHRTGVMTAVYRMTRDGWSADRAYQEMKQFNFEGFPGHPVLKQFVYDYYSQFGRSRVAGTQTASTTVATLH